MSVINYKVNNHIAQVILNRPDSMNTFNPEMYQSFNKALAAFRDNEEAWVCVIGAAGDKAFSAGVDITALPELVSGSLSREEREKAIQQFSIDLEGEYYCDKPIIVAIHGYCIGEGLSIALSCDLRIADESAIFSLPEAKIGLPTINAAIHGANKMGISNILELLLLGEKRDAAWAYRTGLVNKVVPIGKALETAMDWAKKITQLSPGAIRITKEAAVRSRYRTFEEVEKIAIPKREELLKSNDIQEAILAFLEKRKPKFTGK